ncbi:MAG TPA: transglycosylase domain-containing protein [Verrucomicrobiae bacterium]|nr:transglycosylase domain-containing protein [Verrucomicrobiae bacterium]
MEATAEQLESRLDRLDYRRVRSGSTDAGSYSARGDALEINLRGFRDLQGDHPAERVRVAFSGGVLTHVTPGPALLEPETLAIFQGPNLEERELVRIEDCPKQLVDAILVAEDRRFFNHPGIDPAGIFRALWVDVSSRRMSQGGSTLTQQLAKNLYFTGERTLTRKASEAFAALVLELNYPKERILRAYLNEVYLGQHGPASVNGFGRASRHYFGKKIGDLTLGESALLAGLIRAPGLYNPFLHADRARERRDAVLHMMAEAGTITKGESERAVREPIRVRKPASASSRGAGAYVVDLIRQDLESKYGADFWKRPLRVFTSIDPWGQEIAERAVADGLRQLERAYRALKPGRGKEPLQAALVSIRLDDGSISALVGGRSFDQSQFNRILSAKRQPGSLFKPVVYLAGITAPPDPNAPARRRPPSDDDSNSGDTNFVRGTSGVAPDVVAVRWDRAQGDGASDDARPRRKRHRFHWWWQKPDPTPDPSEEEPPEIDDGDIPALPLTAATILKDAPYEIVAGGKTWAPHNDDDEFRGPVTVQRVLEESLNVPTARAAAAIGLPRIISMGHALGITSSLPEVPSLALGAAEVSPFEMATVFTTIASGGHRRPADILLGIELQGSAQPASASTARSDAERGVPEEAAHLMTALLEGVLDRGTARSARDLGYAGVAAGKTGTSDDGRDLWFCGYTPRVLTLVWVGFDDNRPTHLTGARAALPIWVDYMQGIGSDARVPFESDADLVWASIDPTSGGIATSRCPDERRAPFIRGTEPTDACAEHQSFWSRWRS